MESLEGFSHCKEGKTLKFLLFCPLKSVSSSSIRLDTVVNDGITAQWHSLITDAQSASGIILNVSVENYLINTLIHYTQRPDIAKRVFAIDYLKIQHQQGHVHRTQLRELADQCLLYAGLFPQYAKRHNLSAGYYIDIGRSAYIDLANIRNSISTLFEELSESFIKLMKTLLAIQFLKTNDYFILEPLIRSQAVQQPKPSNILNLIDKLNLKN